jgi:hypothetical protein
MKHAIDEVHDGLFVFVHQFLKSGGVALFDAQHQGGIGILLFGGRHSETLTNTGNATRFEEKAPSWTFPGISLTYSI